MIDKEKLIKLLTKRAEGFMYKEVISEYSGYEDEEVQEQELCDKKIKTASNDEKMGALKNKKNILPTSDIFDPILKNVGVQCSCEAKEPPKRVRTDCGGLRLIKRKVSRHYVQPDMIAMKLLLEVMKTDDDSTLSLDELLSLKSSLENELGLEKK